MEEAYMKELVEKLKNEGGSRDNTKFGPLKMGQVY
jgi:hypothetical protein